MSTKMIQPVLGLLAVAILPMLASAHPAPAELRASEEDRQACTPDVFRLCSQFVPHAEQITICLQQRIRYLSSGCRAVFMKPAKE
jgi:hypothetical protein